jgi:hypothetical protein
VQTAGEDALKKEGDTTGRSNFDVPSITISFVRFLDSSNPLTWFNRKKFIVILLSSGYDHSYLRSSELRAITSVRLCMPYDITDGCEPDRSVVFSLHCP